MIWFKIRELISASPAKRDSIIIFNLAFCLIIDLALWLILLTMYWNSREFIVLRTNIYFGISDLNAWYFILLLPLFGLVIILVDFFLALYLYLKQQMLSYLLAFTASACLVALALASAILIYINL